MCRVCELNGRAYCDFSCSLDNGGCNEGETCREEEVTCPPGQCCSKSIDCERKSYKKYKIYMTFV